jgi:pimeloyl-ACP methyl ester carboxylesterase
VGYHLATRAPDRIRGLIVQSGNAHDDGLGEQWNSAKAYWADPSDDTRAELPDWLNFAGTRDQYLAGLPEYLRDLPPPESWHLDWERMTRPGNLDAQFALFADYANHVARFDELAKYHRAHQPPALVLWGRAASRRSPAPCRSHDIGQPPDATGDPRRGPSPGY